MNRVTIQPTVFENRPTGEKAYGYRMYDNQGQTYYNSWELIPDDDLEILALVLDDMDVVAQLMLDFVQGHEQGIYIGKEWYNWDQIKHLFSEVNR